MDSNELAFIHTRSYYSFLESLLSPARLVKIAANYDVTALGLIDHNYLSGVVEFYEACQHAGIKPIIGLEIDLQYHQFTGRFTLIAKDISGWRNLSRISSLTNVDGENLNLNILSEYKYGLIALTGGYQSILKSMLTNSSPGEKSSEHLIADIKNIYSEDFFIEVQRYVFGPLKNEQALINLSNQFSIKLIASQIITYEQPKDQNLFKTITAIRNNIAREQIYEPGFLTNGFYFPTKPDFIHRFRDLPNALRNLSEITDRCNFTLPIGKTHYPVFPTPPGVSQSEYLKKRAYDGAKWIYSELSSSIIERLDYELSIIIEMGYEPIFLIMEDVLNHARELGIPTSSRGSAASSLVAHCLNITSPDPMALNLYFERFLNPARKKPPDIDTDIASHRRDEVIQYVFEKYHHDKVAMVGTINRYRPKSALNDVAKSYGLPPGVIRQLSKRLPSSFRFQVESEHTDPFSSLIDEATIPIITEIVNDARSLLNVPKHLSVHPGGIVISPFPITDMIPLTHSQSLGINHAQYDLEGIEKFGMVKLDLLGIRGLTVLGKVADQIQTWHQSEYKNGLEVLEKIPLEDPETAEIILSGRTIGCFQIESPGMRSLLKEIQAKSFEDIMVGLALYRPGPLRGGLRDAFVRRFRGEEPVSHIHKSLVNILDETLGVIIYQEQVLMIAHQLGGLSIAQADILRRVMSHPNSGEALDTLREHFVNGAVTHKNVPVEIAEHIWEMMAAFAGYGYPKAHAASYAQLAWQSAWCKAHYPAEFMCAVLGYGGGYYSQRVYLMEARRLGLTIKPPNINTSNQRFRVTYPKGKPILYMGLDQVRELTQKTIQAIINSRPFNSVEDFLIRVEPQPKEAKHLIMCGALEEFATIPTALELINFKRQPGQLDLFNIPKIEADWDDAQKSKAQLETLGVTLETSPLEQFTDLIQSIGAVTTGESENFLGQDIWIVGMRQAFRRFHNQPNLMIGHLTLEDFEGSLPVLISTELYRKHYDDLRHEGPFLIKGRMEKNRGQARLIAETINLLK